MPDQLLKFARFNPSRGGHAPGEERDAFLQAIEIWHYGEPEPSVEFRGHEVAIRHLCGKLWNCTDVMPVSARNALTDGIETDPFSPPIITYAQGARLLKESLADR